MSGMPTELHPLIPGPDDASFLASLPPWLRSQIVTWRAKVMRERERLALLASAPPKPSRAEKHAALLARIYAADEAARSKSGQ